MHFSSHFIMLFVMAIVYLVTCLSSSFLIWRASRIRPEYCPWISQGLVMTWMFLAGVYECLDLGTVILKGALILLFIILLGSSFISLELRRQLLYFVRANKIFIALVLISPFIFAEQFIGNGDEWIYWGAVIKEMSATHGLLNGSSAVYPKNYLPGMAVFYYFVLYGWKFSEPLVLMSAFFLYLSSLHCVFARFRSRFLPSLGIFLVLNWIAFKVLGIGVKNLVADQLMICVYFATLHLIYLGGNRVYWILAFPLIELCLAKQFGNVLGLSLIAIFAGRNFYFLRQRNSKALDYLKTLGISILLLFLMTLILGRWERWVIGHNMYGHAYFSISFEKIKEYFGGILKSGVSWHDRRMAHDFLRELFSVRIANFDFAERASRWKFITYFLIASVMAWVVSTLRLKRRRLEFPYLVWVIPGLTLFAWLIGLLLLNLILFSLTQEGPFPSLDRYLSICFAPIFLFISYLFYLKFFVNDQGYKRYFGIVALITFVLASPSSNGLILSKRELFDGSKEQEAYSFLREQGKLKFLPTDTVCFFYEGSQTYIMRGGYEILPAHMEQIGQISKTSNFDFSKFDRKCDFVIGFCDADYSCEIAGRRFPQYFDKKNKREFWIKPWRVFLSLIGEQNLKQQ